MDQHPHKIVVIESFEPEYAGYQSKKHKIYDEFHKNKIKADIKTFYLDCDSYLDLDEKNRMYNFLDTIALWKPELIIVYDDQATYTLMASRHPLVKQIPIVFDGVNFPNWKLLQQHPNITGFWDKPDYLKTFEISEALFGPMYIRIWTDNTALGRRTTKLFMEAFQKAHLKMSQDIKYYINRDGSFTIPSDSTKISKDKKNMLQKPKETTYSLVNARESTSNGLLWSLSGLARYSIFIQSKRDFVSKRLGLYASGPTITIVNEGFGLKEGILGGYITLPDVQIQESVKLACDILKGKAPKKPIITCPKEYLLDWNEMTRWDIDRSKIPSHYHIINMPFFEQYKIQITIISILLGIAIISIILYLIALYRRENRNKQIAQENLKKGERFLSLALAGGKVYAFQLTNDIFSFDKEFYADAGIEEKLLTMDEFRNSIHPHDMHKFNDNVENARLGKIQKNISQMQCNFNNRGYQWWEFRYTYNKEKDIFNGLCLNIQKTKEAEQELINARQRAEESDKMKTAFLANMSHEIRTPLNAIVGFSNIIAEEEISLSTEERSEFLKLINSNSELLLKLINDILDLSRIESGKMEFSFVSCNLTDLLTNIFHTHQVLMPENVVLKIDVPEHPVFLRTDPHRLTQVITNFINNASKFTQKGYIKIGYKFESKEETVKIYVEDTGIGIPKEKQKAVFERFNKLDEFAQGTGLGLAICQVIIKRFNGKIELQSEKEKGSCFTIALPLHNA